ncbi:MAG: FecR family protein [Methylotenera sp.]
MQFRDIKLAIAIVSLLIYSGSTLANNAHPRTCSADNLYQNTVPTGGSGGTGHDPGTPPGGIGGTGNTAPPGGIGGNGIEAAAETGGIGGTGNTVPPGGIGGNGIEATLDVGGIGGTGNTAPVPPGGIGGTGITTAGVITKASGSVLVMTDANHQLALAEGDEVCSGDRIVAAENSQAKITFSDGALLHVLQNTEINIVDYYYASATPEQSRSVVSLLKGDIRSVSGAISKINPEQYAIKTPAATIRVIGTDFMVTHLPENNEGLLTGTYTKVISGEVNVISKLTKILLRAGESSHVLLNGIQSIIKSSGGTCILP